MTGESLEGLAAGDYTVTATDYYGCAMGSKTVTVDSNTGIEDQLAAAGIQTLETFPNPTEGVFTVRVELAKMDDLTLRVFDINSREIYSEATSAIRYEQTVDLSKLPAGVYTLQLQTSTGAALQRIVRR